LSHEADGAVVADGHVRQADTFLVRDGYGGFPQVVAAAAGDVAGQPLLDGGPRDVQARDLQR
jgi:hypothetical protein